MATKSGRTRGNRGSKNNNPTGRNQYSGGMIDLARERPIAAAAVAAGAAATGLFLWSKRAQITDQLSSLSDQIGEWTDSMRSGSTDEFGTAEATGTEALVSSGTTARKGRSSRKSQTQLSEEALSLKQTGENI
jgi:hypothetical protein